MHPDDQSCAIARAELARLLGACFRVPPPGFAEQQDLCKALCDATARVDPVLAAIADRVDAAFRRGLHVDLRLDHARLFAGRTDALAKPYGSVWLDDDAPLVGDSTMAVLQHYEDGGFEVDEGFRDLPDHVAVELEFLYVLLFRLADASVRGDDATLRGADTMRRRFLAEHLGAWIGPFATAVRGGAESAFYRELGSLAERFVTMEAARSLSA